MGERQRLRDLIADAGGAPPPSSATIAQLTVILDEIAGHTDSGDLPAAPDAGDSPQSLLVQPARCAAGRPLLTDTICRHCYIRGQTECDGV